MFSIVYELEEKKMLVTQCVTLCDPMDCSLPGSSVYGVFLERILEWVAISSSNNSWYILPNFSPEHTVTDLVVLVVQSYQTLCDPMNCSPPGSSVHGISEASILEWAASSSSKGSSRPRDWTHISCIGRQIVYHCTHWEAHFINYLTTSFNFYIF